jgi:hypothetical protein
VERKPDELLVYCDETYPDNSRGARIRIVGVAVRASDFERLRPEIRKLAGRRRRKFWRGLLELVRRPEFYFSVVEIDRNAVYGQSLFESDLIPGIGELSRPNNLWSQGVVYATAYAVRVLASCWERQPFHVFYDESTLTAAHLTAFEAAILKQIAQFSATEQAVQGLDHVVEIASLQAVRTPSSTKVFTRDMDGIWLADSTASLVDKIDANEFAPNFLFRDCTPIAISLAAHAASHE